MIPAIGLMIGAYIATRMLELLAGSHPNGQTVTRVFAALTLIVVLFSVIDLLLGGASVIDLLDSSGGLPMPYQPPR